MNKNISTFDPKKDLLSSIVVFLVALPLCLGIALASNAPPMSGIIAGIIGAIIVGFLSKSHTSVSGPAAGLTAVVAVSLADLHSNFSLFLTALFIAGVIQIIFSAIKAGILADFIPSNVIKGLLAAIGIILILKQIPHALGYDIDEEGDFSFFQHDGENSFSEIFVALSHVSKIAIIISLISISFLFFWGTLNKKYRTLIFSVIILCSIILIIQHSDITPVAIIISLISLLILIYWEKILGKLSTFIPASLIVVILGAFFQFLSNKFFPDWALIPDHLVHISSLNFQDMGNLIYIPNLNDFKNTVIWKVAFTLAIVASIETLLNIEAIDKIDPHKRVTPPNRELFAQGVGNMFSGILGGIPITSVIVRSNVNIISGNNSKYSSILHGFLLIVTVLWAYPIINYIPLASLAAILIYTGYKLVKPSLIKAIYQQGWNQFIPFVITVLGIVFTDLLIGVMIGAITSIFFLLKSNYKYPFLKTQSRILVGEVIQYSLPTFVSFLNKASIKSSLYSIPKHSKVIIDLENTEHLDHDIKEIIEDFANIVADENKIKVNIIAKKNFIDIKNSHQFKTVPSKEVQSNLTPDDILETLKDGNKRFQENTQFESLLNLQVLDTSSNHFPVAMVLGCLDSRTAPELIFDMGIGQIATVRIAGNIVSEEIIQSIEFAVVKLGVKLIIVLGHTQCGAINEAINNPNQNSSILSKIYPSIAKAGFHEKSTQDLTEAQINIITNLNALNSVNSIKNSSRIIAEKLSEKSIILLPAFYNVETKKVEFIEN